MTDKFKAFWLGLFIILALVLVAWLILFLKPAVGNGELDLKVRFSNIDKISEGTLVTFAGKPVGEVVEIIEIADPREAPSDCFGNLYIYELTLQVDSSVRVFTYDEIIFTTSGLLGERSISIMPKAASPGSFPARDMTHEILYAHSTDKLDEALNRIVGVTEAFNEVMEETCIFIETNSHDFNTALRSVTCVANAMQDFLLRAKETDVIARTAMAMTRTEDFFTLALENNTLERLGSSFDCLHEAAALFSHGNGTIARLVNSDCFYVQLHAAICQFQILLHNLNDYGLFYQFSRKWQKETDLRSAVQK